MSTTYMLAIIPGQLPLSARHAITQATGRQVTAEANAIIQATLDYITVQRAVPAMLMTNAMRAELVADTAATFYANGPETRQVVRDVIEYVDSWLQVQLGRAKDAAQAAPAAPTSGGLVSADDVRSLTRQLDVALNGDGAAPHAALCDVVGQVEAEARRRNAPVLTPAAPVAVPLTNQEAEDVFRRCGGQWRGDKWAIGNGDMHTFVLTLAARWGVKLEGGE